MRETNTLDPKAHKYYNGCYNTHAPPPQCTSLVQPRPDILFVLSAHNDSQPPLTPSPPNTIEFIKFAYYYDILPTNVIRDENTKIHPFKTNTSSCGVEG